MPSFGVVVGRFQVHELHEGHLELLRTVCGLHNRIIVFLGVAAALYTRQNPLDFETRKAMIQAKFPQITVLPLPDVPNDEDWSQILDRRIREVAPMGEITLYGARSSFVPCYSGHFKPMELPLLVPKTISGASIRAEISNSVRESPDFRAGIIFSTQNRFPAAIMCVDCAIVNEDFTKILLEKKEGELGWRFPGGHLDPERDGCLEDAVKFEGNEETSLHFDYVQYIASFKVNDWRNKGEVDQRFSALFLCVNSSGVARVQDKLEGIKQLVWHTISALRDSDIEVCHQPLFSKLWKFKYLGDKNRNFQISDLRKCAAAE